MKIRVLFLSLPLLILVIFVTRAPVEAFHLSSPVKCSEPSEENASLCRELAQRILRSTVRITITGQAVDPSASGGDTDYSVGHATVMGGRYLVTHNHFGVKLPGKHGEGPDVDGKVHLYSSAGRHIFGGPLSDFSVVVEAGETLVLAYKDEGFFEKLGLTSAEFKAWTAPPIEPGMEVAQVDWDGETTRVDWVEVQDVVFEAGVLRLIVDDRVWPGASGGGIFWQGVHVANNWLFQAKLTENCETYDEVTTAALNPIVVLELYDPEPGTRGTGSY